MRALLIYCATSFALLISTDLLAQGIRSNEATICYFSLNNTNEFVSMEKVMNVVNATNNEGARVKVREYMLPNGNPEAAFKKMVQDKANCNALVISGHHTASYGGKNTDGSNLRLSFIEKMGCDPEHKEWFNNITALWLQGCRTVGVDKIVPNETANRHTRRVGGARRADNLYQSAADMNHEFTMTLDRDNPLSSRYLKIFPNATVFGWTNTAPGENSRSDRSLIYHIAHMAKINDYRRSPVIIQPKSGMTAKSAGEYINAALDIIHKPRNPCEPNAIESWKNHGQVFGINKLKGFESFNSSANDRDQFARDLGCKYINAKSHQERMSALRDILQNPDTIAMNFNKIVETVLQPGQTAQERNEMFGELRANPTLRNFVTQKIRADYVGVFPKIDYYTFYKAVYGERSSDLERLINVDINIELIRKFPTNQNSDEFEEVASYKTALYQSLAKNNYIDKTFMENLFRQRSGPSKEEAEISFMGIYDNLPKGHELIPQIEDMKRQIRPEF